MSELYFLKQQKVKYEDIYDRLYKETLKLTRLKKKHINSIKRGRREEVIKQNESLYELQYLYVKQLQKTIELSYKEINLELQNQKNKTIKSKSIDTFYKDWNYNIKRWCIHLCFIIWMFCKFKSLSPRFRTIDLSNINISFDTPWYLSYLIPDVSSFIVPVIITTIIIIILVFVYITNGNTVSSISVTLIILLMLIWNLDDDTITLILFSICRLIIYSIVLSLAISTFINIGKVLIPEKRKQIHITYIYFVFLYCSVVSFYLGFWLYKTDKESCWTYREKFLYDTLNSFIKSI